jgi:hypothetical protein
LLPCKVDFFIGSPKQQVNIKQVTLHLLNPMGIRNVDQFLQREELACRKTLDAGRG